MSTTPPRIAILCERFTLRGSCLHTLRLADLLQKQGIAVCLVVPDLETFPAPARQRHQFISAPYLRTPGIRRVAMAKIERQLREFRPDVLHVQTRRALWLGNELSRRLHRPYVVTIHDYLLTNEILWLDHRWCRRLIAVSDSVREEVVNQPRINPEDVVTIPCGVVDPAVAEPQAFEQEILSPQRAPVVGTAGPLEPVKGIEFFLDAARIIARDHDTAQFLISGAGPEEAKLRKQAASFGISARVTFAPNVVDFSGSLKAMDLFCLPSLQQGLGTIMLEAMAYQRAVIASSVGGVFGAVRQNETGLLVPPSSGKALAAAVLELLANVPKARRLAKAGRDLILTEFRADDMVEKTLAIYQQILDATRFEQSTVFNSGGSRTGAPPTINIGSQSRSAVRPAPPPSGTPPLPPA